MSHPPVLRTGTDFGRRICHSQAGHFFVRKQFETDRKECQEFLSKSYFRYFKGRNYTDSTCYLTITQESKKSRLFSYDNKKWRDFLVKIRKVHDQLHDAGLQVSFLNKTEANRYVDRFFSMDFKNSTITMSNIKADDETLSMGDKRCKVYSLVDVDCVNLPSLIRPYMKMEVNNSEMPSTCCLPLTVYLKLKR